MRFSRIIIVFSCFISSLSFTQQLFINEVSQGTSGAEEYVEFIVVGAPTCITPVPCIDLRGVLIDDNNGYFSTSSSGSGVAPGAIRFANNSFWSCVPQGTLIVIYNESDINAAVPANDISLTDGNCRLILPASSNLLEGQTISPNSSDPNYPPSGSWIAGGGVWSQLGMSNTNDSFQIRTNISSSAPYHSVSWGNNNLNTLIYFTTAAGNCFSMLNSLNNDPTDQSNWTSATASSSQTPGSANSPENAAWISSMNPQCGVANPLTVNLSVTPISCGGNCNGAITSTVSGGVSPYQYSWSNTATTSSITNLCAATYTLNVTDFAGCTTSVQGTVTVSSATITINVLVSPEECENGCNGVGIASASGGASPYGYVWQDNSTNATNSTLCAGNHTLTATDQNGCTATVTVNVQPGTAITPAVAQNAGPFTTNDPSVQLSATPAGGSWTANCGSCVTSSGQFNPQSVSAGSYSVCYTSGTSPCSSTDCITIVVTQGCAIDTTEESLMICPTDTLIIETNVISAEGDYAFQYTNQTGCDSIHIYHITEFVQFPENKFISLCEGDTTFVYGIAVFQSDVITENTIDLNGCPITNTTTIVQQNCDLEDFNVFIPNVFTPNGDESNNIFKIQYTGAELTEGFIVNRWGNVVAEFGPENNSWDGTFNGEICNDGVYIYSISLTPIGGSSQRYNGFVTLIR